MALTAPTIAELRPGEEPSAVGVGQRSVLAVFDAAVVSAQARAEARRRETYLPVISLYRWWARRTTSVAKALIDAAAATLGRGDLVIADPFAGGGVIALTALLSGHTVIAQELDPWAVSNLRAMATPGPPYAIDAIAVQMGAALKNLGDGYRTVLSTGEAGRVACTIRVAATHCPGCGAELRLYPSALVSRTKRIDTNGGGEANAWFACPAGHLHKSHSVTHNCPVCRRRVQAEVRYTSDRRVTCWSCHTNYRIPSLVSHDTTWEVVLVQRIAGQRQEIAQPTKAEQHQAADQQWVRRALGPIPVGAETNVLLRYGFNDFADLYPARQLTTLTTLLEAAEAASAGTWARNIARACVIGAAEFAGLATRWDPSYLKPYETLASHRYNTTTLTVEIDPWGDRGRGTALRRLTAAAKASRWLAQQSVPRRVGARTAGSRKVQPGNGLTVVSGSSTSMPIPDGSVDLILTDPPYHDDVQYADLASIFRTWGGHPSGRLEGDVTAVRGGGRAEDERFRTVLTTIFTECRRVIAIDGHMVLSFANRDPQAWIALLSALQAADWQACGFDVVHAENETDHSKNGKKACTLDLLLDLIPAKIHVHELYGPTRDPASAEEEFCFIVGAEFLKVGTLSFGWEEHFNKALQSCVFITLCRIVT
jgi:putative DNA methylase